MDYMSRRQEFVQGTLFPAHTVNPSTGEIKDANRWARETTGVRGARVSYVSPENNWEATGTHRLAVTIPRRGAARQTVSRLQWMPNGEVLSVSTSDAHRRQGLARGLWHIAKALGSERPDVALPHHSDVLTPDGRAWSKAVGE